MKKNAMQTLIFLNSRSSVLKLDNTSVHKVINNLPKTNVVNIERNANKYATT